jgi:hypothetical protein
MIFHTIRRGFPTANLMFYGNGMSDEMAYLTASCCRAVNAQFTNIPRVAHGVWIEGLVTAERDPFWICDTDVVFFEPVQDWFVKQEGSVVFAGRKEPQFWEPWTKTIHVARLHPSLMYFNPQLMRAEMRSWPKGEEFLATVSYEMFKWHMVPLNGKMYFHDTMSGAHQALGGTEFTPEQNNAFEHLFNGTYIHLMPDMRSKMNMHDAISQNPRLARGLWAEQQQWYVDNAC